MYRSMSMINRRAAGRRGFFWGKGGRISFDDDITYKSLDVKCQKVFDVVLAIIIYAFVFDLAFAIAVAVATNLLSLTFIVILVLAIAVLLALLLLLPILLSLGLGLAIILTLTFAFTVVVLAVTIINDVAVVLSSIQQLANQYSCKSPSVDSFKEKDWSHEI